MNTTPSSRISWLLNVAFALSIALFGGNALFASAQESAIPVGAPVDIHSGACSDFVDEPAYDGGEIKETTTDDIWSEDTLQAGIFEDQQLQASGIDFNGDGALQPNEVITPNGVSVPAGRAQADLESGVDTDQPYVVAIHASADAYSTVIACGSIDGAQETDGQRIIRIQPVTDQSSAFGFAVLGGDNDQLTTYLFQPNTAPLASPAPAEAQADLTALPLDIHEGTCNDFTAEPIYDLGELKQTNEYAPDEQDPGDMSGEIPQEAKDLGPVYKVRSEDIDFGDQNLLEGGPFVVAAHQSPEDYATIVSCGQILPVMDGDNIVVFMHPVGGDEVGYVELNTGDSTAQGYLWQVQNYTPKAEATPTPGPSPVPVQTPTPVPTPTQEATAVIVETQVVSAATATAIAQGQQATAMAAEPVPVDIGGDSAAAVTASPNQTLALTNGSKNERTFTVADLQLEATVGGGQKAELLIPENTEPGTYTYQVLEGGTVVFEGEFTVQ
jgi:hypothetical protein